MHVSTPFTVRSRIGSPDGRAGGGGGGAGRGPRGLFPLHSAGKKKKKEREELFCFVFLPLPQPRKKGKQCGAHMCVPSHCCNGAAVAICYPPRIALPPLQRFPPHADQTEGRYSLCVVVSTTGYLAHPWGGGLGREQLGEGGDIVVVLGGNSGRKEVF